MFGFTLENIKKKTKIIKISEKQMYCQILNLYKEELK